MDLTMVNPCAKPLWTTVLEGLQNEPSRPAKKPWSVRNHQGFFVVRWTFFNNVDCVMCRGSASPRARQPHPKTKRCARAPARNTPG